MMASISDTFKVSKKLVEKGYTEEQAEGFIEAIKEIDLEELATKKDLAHLESKLKEFKTETKAEFKILEMKMTIKMGAMIFLLGGYLTAMKFFG